MERLCEFCFSTDGDVHAAEYECKSCSGSYICRRIKQQLHSDDCVVVELRSPERIAAHSVRRPLRLAPWEVTARIPGDLPAARFMAAHDTTLVFSGAGTVFMMDRFCPKAQRCVRLQIGKLKFVTALAFLPKKEAAGPELLLGHRRFDCLAVTQASTRCFYRLDGNKDGEVVDIAVNDRLALCALVSTDSVELWSTATGEHEASWNVAGECSSAVWTPTDWLLVGNSERCFYLHCEGNTWRKDLLLTFSFTLARGCADYTIFIDNKTATIVETDTRAPHGLAAKRHRLTLPCSHAEALAICPKPRGQVGYEALVCDGRLVYSMTPVEE